MLEGGAQDEDNDDSEVSAHFLTLRMIYVPYLSKLTEGPVTSQISKLPKRTADNATTADSVASERKVIWL